MVEPFLAAAAPVVRPDPFMFYLPLVLLGVALLIGAVWAARVVRDLRSDPTATADNPDDLLGPLAEAFASGQMSEEEYLRLKSSVEKVAGPISDRLRWAGPISRRPSAPPSDEL